ncbi:hypothetical protein Bca52824_056536 [Brassica carinata]|uniref:GRF-type domain-containing protein n=1 Tax=Brassica carinata TaxID=52824 RepID=A0A8X7UFE0_BRACI|nr:hypothetical protein Bca52824_056536 [Brassica carinata]
MNPGNQYPGYVDFLHSVSGNNAQGNFSYESFPYSLYLRASQIPPFSSQQTEAPSQPDNPPVETPGMAVEDFKSVHELKMEDLAKKERLSKLAILDTLLAKKEPTEREENAMGLDYSYTQPSESEDYGLGGSADSGNSSTEMYIQLDQAQIKPHAIKCYCGGEPLVATSYTRTDPRRMFYTCKNKQDGDCHVYKWWDVAATEEIKAIGAQVTLLTDKLDSLSFVGYEETELRELKEVQFDMEQKLVRLKSIVCDLGRKKSRFGNGFELVLGVLVVVLVIIAIGVAARMIMYLLSHLQSSCNIEKTCFYIYLFK